MARKRKSKPTSSKRNQKQSTKERYSKAREDAQLVGIIPTTPEGAVRPERVDPSTQDGQRFPGLDRAAIRGGQGWAVPEHIKRKVVEKAAEVLYQDYKMTVTGVDGVERVVELPPDRRAEAQAARTLMEADERQWERDKPEEAGKARGGVNVGVAVSLDPFEAYKRMVEELEEEPKDPLQEAIEEAKAAGEHTATVARDAVQSATGSQQEILAGGEVLQGRDGDTEKPDTEHRNGSNGRKQAR